ncbi:MAG: hypothetical protein AAFZ91_01025 [Pseudomonadota bacterium]
MNFGYLIPITPREMPFGLDVLDPKDRSATSQNQVRRFGLKKNRKKT